MPKISEFYGIKIFIFWNEQGKHHIPHFHAVYNENQAAFTLDGQIIIGSFPNMAKNLIKTWALENQEMIYYAWTQALENKPVPKIKGIK
jgi:hypothetical protein